MTSETNGHGRPQMGLDKSTNGSSAGNRGRLADETLRIGVIGCGYWGSKHVRVLSGLAGIGSVAVIDRDPATRSALTTAYPSVVGFAELDQALPAIDALVVATPPQSHATLALQAIAAGKHVLIEKPMTATLAESEMLIAAADSAGVMLMAGHTFAYNPAVRELRRRMVQNEIGEIYHIHSARLNLGLYRSDVDVVWDLAPHDISIMNDLLDAVPDRVSAWGSAHACRDVNDLAYIKLHYDSRKVTGHVHVSWIDPRKVRTLTVVGSKKMAVYDDTADERLRIFDCGVESDQWTGLAGAAADGEAAVRRFAYRQGDIVSLRLPGDEPLVLENRHFIECIRSGQRPLTDGQSGRAVVAVLEAIDRAITTGTTVDVRSPRHCEAAPFAQANAGWQPLPPPGVDLPHRP